MINAEQAREIIAKIDWKSRMLDHIGRNIESLADSGYTKYEHKFYSSIPENQVEDIVKELGNLGYFVFPSATDKRFYAISWKAPTNI